MPSPSVLTFCVILHSHDNTHLLQSACSGSWQGVITCVWGDHLFSGWITRVCWMCTCAYSMLPWFKGSHSRGLGGVHQQNAGTRLTGSCSFLFWKPSIPEFLTLQPLLDMPKFLTNFLRWDNFQDVFFYKDCIAAEIMSHCGISGSMTCSLLCFSSPEYGQVWWLESPQFCLLLPPLSFLTLPASAAWVQQKSNQKRPGA